MCTRDLGDLTAKTKAGTDQLLGMRLAAQILHVQWGFSDNMSTSPAAVASGLQSINWQSLQSCSNDRQEKQIHHLAPVEKYLPKTNAVKLLRRQAAATVAPSTVAATPPMGCARAASCVMLLFFAELTNKNVLY